MDSKWDVLVWEVIEINPMGDHTVIARYTNENRAITVKDLLTAVCEEPCTSYYINDIREEY